MNVAKNGRQLRVNPTLPAVRPSELAICHIPNSIEPAAAAPRKPQARSRAPCRMPRNASSSGMTVCSGMITIDASTAPVSVA
jgi:hypothetical protein